MHVHTHTHTHTIPMIFMTKVMLVTVKKRHLDKEEKQSDSNNLYDDVTPTPKKVAKSRKVVKKSQISAPILHNSSVSSYMYAYTYKTIPS